MLHYYIFDKVHSAGDIAYDVWHHLRFVTHAVIETSRSDGLRQFHLDDINRDFCNCAKSQ